MKTVTSVRRYVLIWLGIIAVMVFASSLAYAQETDVVITSEVVSESEDIPSDIFVSAEDLLLSVTEDVEATSTEESEGSSEVATSSEGGSEETPATTTSESDSESQSAAAVLSTDKDDYHPGETATIFGRFFAPLETFLIKVFGSDENDQNYTETEEEVTADENGEFTFDYVLDSLYRPFYEVIVSTLQGEKVAETWFRDSSIGTYDQCSNDDGDGYATGDTGCRWTNGNIQANNSTYFEGDSTVQRLWIEGYVPGSSHTVTFKYGTTKGGSHAYDYLTTWNASENWLSVADRCQDITGCTTATEATAAMQNDPNVTDTIEPAAASRLFTIRGGTITNVSVPTIVSGTYAGDSETVVTVTFTVGPSSGSMCSTKKVQGQDVTSCGMALWFGAHVAKGSEWTVFNGTTGAGTIAGSPYHVALDSEDGTSIGQRDNQMQSAAIVQVSSITIVKDAVPNDAQDFAFTTTGTGLGNFSLDDDANGTLSNTQTFTGLSAGTYTVTEGAVGGWSLTNLVCVDPTTNTTVNLGTRSASINLAAGEDVTCTFTNTLEQAHLTLLKTVVNDNGGGALDTAWTLAASGPTPISGVEGNAAVTNAAVNAGVYTLSESGGPNGYTASTYSCVNNGGAPVESNSITLAPGDNATCTITNDDQQAYITVIKEVTNDNGGSAAPDDFALTLEGDAVNSGVQVPVNPGTYTAEETQISGYTFEGYTGDCDGNGDVTVALGESKTCTLTNNDQPSYIIIDKTVVNDNGGTAGPDDFNLTVDGNPALDEIALEVTPGAHTAGETLLLGYAAGDWGGDCDAQGLVTVPLGETKTCTITNNDIAPSLTLVKEVVNDNGGDAVAADWTLTADGPTDISGAGGAVSGADFVAGTYSLSESTGPDGYTAGAWSCVGGTQNGAEITLALDEDATCTIVNDDETGTLKVTKITDPVSDNTTEFSITASGDGEIQGDATQTIVGGQTVEYTVDQGTYDVAETDLAGWIETENTCNDIVVPNGGEGSCSITNVKLAEVTIVKEATPNDAQDFTFNNDFGGVHPATFLLDDDANATLPKTRTFLVMPGTYSVTEDATTGWEFDGAACTDGSPNTAIDVIAGEQVTCTFENQKLGTIVLVKNTLGGDGTFEFDLTGESIPDTASLTTVAGTDSETYSNVDPDNTYAITETTPDGWEQVSVSCVQTNGTEKDASSFAIASGQTVTCTFTNGKLPTLTLEKTVVNDHNGPAIETDFTPSIDATATTWDTTVTLEPGTYTASETILDTYVAGDWGGDCAADGSVTLAYGDTKTCTITNDDKPGEIHGMKFNDENANGVMDGDESGLEGWVIFLDENGNGELDGDELSDTTDGDGHYSFTGLALGTYVVREQGQTGWFQTTTNPSDIELDNGEVVEDIDFGNYAIESLTVTKTAATTYTRTHNWGITKVVDDETVDLFTGDSQTVNYDVTVTKTGYTDSDWAVTGTITITNPNAHASLVASITDVTDSISNQSGATVVCPGGLNQELAAGAILECTYSTPLTDGDDELNTATVVTTGLVPGGEGTAAVDFGEPTTEVNDTVNVTDTYEGSLGSTDITTTFEYDRPLTCGGDNGYTGLGNLVENTATITETNQSADEDVTVNCYDLTVTKDASTSYTKTWTWDITKTSDTSRVTLAPGATYPVDYEVTVSATSQDSAWAATGTIVITNPAPIAAPLASVTDTLTGDIAATVDCGLATEVPANDSLECTYEVDLTNADTLTNTAEVTLANGTIYSGTAEVNFAEAVVTEVDESIEVTDDKQGVLGTVLASEVPETFNYTLNVGPYDGALCGIPQEFDNTATLTTNDTDTTEEAQWTVAVNVQCVCSLTQGYWKTHNETFYGGAPADDNWYNLGALAEGTTFYLSGKTWYNAFWTAPKGNVYYNLAHQYMAAKLNVLNGASGPTITANITAAETLLNTYTPAQIAALKGKNATNVSKQFNDLAGKLGAFNEGITNPAGHCSEIPQ